MKFDIFCSLCQGGPENKLPNERKVFENFFNQAKLADELGFENLWLAESHLSSEVQKENKNPVIPHFKGEVGLNNDLLQIAHNIFSITKNINVGSAIKNILCNGGPLAHAEALRYFLYLKDLSPNKDRKINLGFASGRFEYSNKPYGISPRNEFEKEFWKIIKGKVILEASQIFLKGLKGDTFSSAEIPSIKIKSDDFSDEESWQQALNLYQKSNNKSICSDEIEIQKWWEFEKLKVIPNETSLASLDLYIGSHSEEAQKVANSILPCKVFNLSITSKDFIEKTHIRMQTLYSQKNRIWQREFMPRTVMVFINGDKSLSLKEQRARAKAHGMKALTSYWQAIDGTLDLEKISKNINNTLCGSPQDIIEQLQERFHPKDRIMLWFDFNCHDNDVVCDSMKTFYKDVIPFLKKT